MTTCSQGDIRVGGHSFVSFLGVAKIQVVFEQVRPEDTLRGEGERERERERKERDKRDKREEREEIE